MTRHHHRGSGPSQRQLRVGELVRRALAEILMRGEHHEPALEGISVTVGEVRMSPDLRVATVFVLPLGGQNADEMLAALEHAKGDLRGLVARAVRLKFAPELRFRLDETFDRMDEVRRLLEDERVRRDLRTNTASDSESGT